jgi:hypothetical protein
MQQLIGTPMLPRNNELRNMKLASFRIHKNEHVRPFVMWYVIVAVHMAKANKYGEVADNRGIAHHRNILEDPLFLLSIHVACRLFMMNGQPMPESYLDLDEWCEFSNSCIMVNYASKILSQHYTLVDRCSCKCACSWCLPDLRFLAEVTTFRLQVVC